MSQQHDPRYSQQPGAHLAPEVRDYYRSRTRATNTFTTIMVILLGSMAALILCACVGTLLFMLFTGATLSALTGGM